MYLNFIKHKYGICDMVCERLHYMMSMDEKMCQYEIVIV